MEVLMKNIIKRVYAVLFTILIIAGCEQVVSTPGIETYTISFDKNDSNATGTMDTLTTEEGSAINLTPCGFSNEGTTFTGWNTLSDGSGTAYNNKGEFLLGNSDITLYAQWQTGFKVTFNVDGGSEIVFQIIENGDKVNLPADPVKSGEVFLGWYKESNFTELWNFNVDIVSSETIIHARWINLNNGDYTYKFTNNNTELELSNCNTDAAGEVIIPALYSGFPVTSIGNFAFSQCTNITSVNIPESVTLLGNWAFSGCVKIETLNIPVNTTSIGNNAFARCLKLTSMNWPENVNDIKDYTFYMCYELRTITIPENVTTIGSYAFYSNSTNVVTINLLPLSPPEIQDTTFSRPYINLHLKSSGTSGYSFTASPWNNFNSVQLDIN